jgi:hypothetical protein
MFKSLLAKIYKRYFLKKHIYPPTTYVHRKNSAIVFEIELNWYDEVLDPVSLVREVKSGKTFSIRYAEMQEFKELSGNAPTDGIEI